jgi:tRNA(Ile)-lysidine synthase
LLVWDDEDFMIKLSTTLPDRIAIGVSGGADSMALLHMLHAAGTTILALTVDHGLRAESVTEAQQVADYCAQLGIPHQILTWAGEKPASAIQAKARQARRDLFTQACRDNNITDLFLGHQADDQVETLLQRLTRGAGPHGLQGIQSLVTQNDLTIHRPLLDIRRRDLRTYCIENNVPFIDDPSNDDRRFERVRWRQLIAQIEQHEPRFADGLLRSQRRLHSAAQALAQLAQAWIAMHVKDDAEKILLPLPDLTVQPQALIVEILRQLMTTEKAYKVDLERLEEWVAQAFSAAPTDQALTLDRWWLRLSKDKITLQPAPPRMQKMA